MGKSWEPENMRVLLLEKRVNKLVCEHECDHARLDTLERAVKIGHQGTYESSVECSNCCRLVSFRVPKGTRVKDFVREGLPTCSQCGCEIAEPDKTG